MIDTLDKLKKLTILIKKTAILNRFKIKKTFCDFLDFIMKLLALLSVLAAVNAISYLDVSKEEWNNFKVSFRIL